MSMSNVSSEDCAADLAQAISAFLITHRGRLTDAMLDVLRNAERIAGHAMDDEL
jgi:hypothetical protein